jgi:hypothetical protein
MPRPRRDGIDGLSTDAVQFESLPDCAIPFKCHACKKVHYWRPRDAWGSPSGLPARNGKVRALSGP